MAGHPEPKPAAVQPAEPSTTEKITVIPPSPPLSNSGGFTLTEAWNKFADTLKTEDVRLFSILTAQAPVMEGETKIVFQISNPLQREPFQKIQPSLLQYLQTALKNEKIEIEIVVPEKSEMIKAYTPEDKFAQMSRKNPALLTFKQQFGLDFD